MEAGESGLYLFSACAVRHFVMAPRFASPAISAGQRCSPDADGPGDGHDHHRDRPYTVGKAVRSTFQSRGHIHVLSIGESGGVGRGILRRRAIPRRGRRRGARLACAARRAGPQSGPLRCHDTRHLWRHRRVCCRTGHLVYLDERDPVRCPITMFWRLIHITLPPSWLRLTSRSNLLYPV